MYRRFFAQDSGVLLGDGERLHSPGEFTLFNISEGLDLLVSETVSRVEQKNDKSLKERHVQLFHPRVKAGLHYTVAQGALPFQFPPTVFGQVELFETFQVLLHLNKLLSNLK